MPPLQHWVPLPMLYHAMSYIDPETGRPRGHMRMASNPLLDSVLLSLDVRSDGWRRADEFVRQGAPALVRVSRQGCGVLAQGGGHACRIQSSTAVSKVVVTVSSGLRVLGGAELTPRCVPVGNADPCLCRSWRLVGA